MFATPDSNRIQYRSASSSTSIGSPTSIQQHQPHQPSQQASYSNLTPRSSVYSDRAVFVPGKSLENEVGSGMQQSGAHTASPPLVASAAGNASRENGSATSAHAGHASDFSNRNRSQSIVALSSPNKHISGSDSRQNWDAQTFYPTRLGNLGGPSNARQQNVTGDNGNVAIPNSGYTSDPSAYKSYDLPRNADSEPRNTREASQWQRIRVERDYSTGIDRQFAVKVPEQMVGKIDEQKFKKFVRRVNALLAEADGATLRNVIEGCLAFATLYISTLVIKPHSRKIIDRISALVQKENESLFRPAGFLVIDPKQTAYMFIEFVRL
ncbi:Golgin sub A member 7 [Coemansia sp. RSA 2703]|nr:Golgin sub A member 7 [Coemansia sp. RSA 2703]